MGINIFHRGRGVDDGVPVMTPASDWVFVQGKRRNVGESQKLQLVELLNTVGGQRQFLEASKSRSDACTARE